MSEFQYDHRFTFMWHTTWTEPCPKCQSLDGRTFTDQSLFQHTLWDPIYGDLWDLDNDYPLIHPNCKCVLEVQYNSTIEELLHPELSKFEEYGIMSSNINTMKSELAEFERSLDGVKKRAADTVLDLNSVYILLRRLHLPPDVERATNVFLQGRSAAIKFAQGLELLTALSAASSLNPMSLIMVGATFGVAMLGAHNAAMELTGQ